MSTTTPSAPGPLRSSGTNNNNASSNKRPTTPLRRISASSLRSLSLSHSRSRPASSSELPLQHLSLLFEELSDAFADLAGNFEGLDGVNEGLDAFNEAFGGYLYGLRVNCYTADFDQAPTRFNFEQVSKRPPPPEQFLPAQQSSSQQYASSDSEDGAQQTQPRGGGNDTTFHTHDSDYSGFLAREPVLKKGSTTGVRGRGRGRGRGGAVGMTRKAKDEMMRFADEIIQLLPIKFREQQPERKQTESVIGHLRSNPDGLSVQAFGTISSDIPTHRINDILTALVRAKVAVKVPVPGSTGEYRLDFSKLKSN